MSPLHWKEKSHYRPSLNEDTDWNESGPQEDTRWNKSISQKDTGWMDYLGSTTGSEDILCQGQGPFDTLENVHKVENHYV